MTSRVMIVATALAASLTVGCTMTRVHTVTNDDTKDAGFRYREPLPYLLLTAPLDVSRSTGETLYTYNVGLGFLPLCDQEDSDKRLDCAIKLQKVKQRFQDQVKPSGQQPASPLPNQKSVIPDATSAVFLTSQHLTSAPPKPPKKGGAGTATTNAGPDPFAGPAASDAAPSNAKASDSAAPVKNDAPLQIIWLPNFCKQYSVTQYNVLSSAELKLQLTNGWELDSVDATGDSTAVVGKLLDTVGAIVGAGKGSGGGGTTKQAAAESVYAKVTVTYLRPGLYPLITCSGNGYTSTTITPPTPATNPAAFGTRTEWVKVIGD